MAKYTDAHGDWNSQPKWVNPLNYTGSAASAGSASPAGVSQQILDQTKLAFNSANSFVEGYVRERFGQSVEDLNSLLYPTYEWLPSFSDIPKKHRMTIASELLENLTMEELIVNVYEQLQKVAVGLEQVVWNLSESGTDFTTLKKFKNMERELQMVLIELQSAMIGLRLEQRPDVVRHAMPESVRDLDQTGRVQRDWVILRDYLNTLEYAIQALTEIRKRH